MRSIICFVGVTLLVTACSTEKKAIKEFGRGEYQNVIDMLSKTNSVSSGKANYYIAESYRLSNRLKEAEPYYAKAGGKGVPEDSVKFYYAESLKMNHKYDDARKILNGLIATTDIDPSFKERVQTELDGIGEIEDLENKSSYYRVKNLDLINTTASEYSPVYLNNELYFTSSRGTGRIYSGNGSPFTDIYKVATRGAVVDMTTVSPLADGINTENTNDGCVTFTPDGRIMVFAKGNTGRRRGAQDVDLYMSHFRNGTWTEPEMIPGSINAPKYWNSTPAFSPDGRTLYFASNRDGGHGGTDIYSARMDSRGRFTHIVNLGSDINTPGDEMFPYVSDDGRMYFSSDGHPGFGGLDIFQVKRENGKTTVENLGSPMNSDGDDFGIFLFRPDRGFFTSNREGGKGDDDIYTFVDEDPNLKIINYYLQGIVYTPAKDSSLQILPNTKVSLYDQSGALMSDFVTGNDGKFLFKVYGNEDYVLVGENDGYLVKRQEYSTRNKTVDPTTLTDLVTNVTLDTTLVLDKIEINKIFVLKNIYYEYNHFNINSDAAKELDKLVDLLKDNPEIKIELSSHTDSIATEEYNLWLSQKRAESAVNYIVQHGIAPDRLVAKGYGESKPIARNTNPDGTDNPEGRAKNRRTEFKILEVNPIAKPFSQGEDESEDDKYFNSNN